MSKSRPLWDNEWIKTSMLSADYNADGHCELCLRMTAGPVWMSIKTGRSRCKQCFTPKGYGKLLTGNDQ